MTNKLFNFLRMGILPNTPPVRYGMRSILLVLGLLLGGLNVWGAEAVTTFANKASNQTWANSLNPLPCETGGSNWASSLTVSQFESTGEARGLQYSCTANTGATVNFTSSDFQNKIIKSVSVIVSRNATQNVNLSVTVNGNTLGSGAAGANNANNVTLSTSNATGINCSTGNIVVTVSTGAPSSKPKSLYVKSITVTYETSGSSDPTVSAEPNDKSYGSVSVSGTTITANPNEGYRVMSGADGYSVIAGEPTSVTNNGDNTFTVSTTEDCTIKINFEAIPQFTVTWNNHGLTSTSQVYEGEKPVFPETPTSCDATSTTFIGWATAPWEDKIDDLAGKTVHTSNATMDAVTTDDIVYYAVFAKSAGGAFDGTTGGEFYIYADIDDTKYYAKAFASKIESTTDIAEAVKYTFEKIVEDETTYFAIKSGDYYLGWSSSTNFTTNNAEPVKFKLESGQYGTWRLMVASTIGTQTPRSIVYRTGTTNKFAPYAVSGINGTEYYDVEIGSGASMSDYMTTCCTKYNVTIADGVAHGSVSADPTSACEDETVTLTFTPDLNYHLDSWSLNGVDQDVDENTFVMLAGNVEVNAVFAQDACTPLATPANAEAVTDYKSAILTWNEVANADKYTVYILTNEDVEVEHGNVTDEEYTVTAPLAASTTYKYTIQAVSNTPATYCPSVSAQGTFSTEALPTAKLTLMENGKTVDGGSHAITVPFALPTEVTHTCGKTFMGWTSKSDFADGDESLASYYEKGAEFTFENTDPVTLYAVYADGGATEETAKVSIASYATTNSWGNGTQHSSVSLDENVTATASSGTNTGKYYTTGNEWRFYQGESAKITIATTVGELSSIKFTYDVDKTGILKDAEDNEVKSATAVPASGTSAVYHVANSGTATNGQVKFTDIEVKYLKPGSYSNYSTTCASAPEVVIDQREVNAPAAGVAAGVIEALYENVDEENISVALYNNEACTEEFDGGWLTASINGDKNIAYTVAASDVYVARTAYIKLTAPETTGATAPAVVVITVSQEAKALVFSSLEDLVAANLASGTEVTVSFSNILITEVYTTNAGYRYGLYLNVKDKDGEKDIELFYNQKGDSEQVPDSWVKNGYVSATNLVTTWTEYKGQWELAMQGATWSWKNGDITYTAPKAVSSVVVSGEPDKKTYVDGEKFNPAGLTVTVNYTIGDPEVIAVTDADWEFTPERLSIGEREISVKATYNTVQSAAFNVTGLTVGEIQLKTVQEFIAAGNADMRCYLEGTVSDIETGSKLQYGNFNLTDASGTIYVYGCLNQAGEAQKFDELDIHNGDKIKVIAEDYDYYDSKHEAKNVQFVSKVSRVQITIADKTLEVGQNWTIEATTDPAAAIDHISYSIKDDGSDAYVSLADNEITANAVGTATIIASIPAGEGYLANEIEFEVEVVEAGSIANVVILAKYDGQWYALMNEYYGSTANSLNALAVDYNEAEGVLLDVAQPSAITWTRSITAGKATFLNGTKYIAGVTGKTDLTLSESASEWTIDESGHYMKSGRTFLYNDGGYFKNYNAGANAGAAHYSDYPVVLANPQFANRAELRGGLMEGKWGTYCPDHDVKYVDGASFYTLTYKEEVAGKPYKVFFDEVEGSTLEGGKPYLFIAEGEAIKGVKVGEDAVLHNYNGFTGVLSDDEILTVTSEESAAYKYYIVYGNEIRLCGAGQFYVPAERAYLNMSQMSSTPVAPAPGRRRISLVNHAAETATGMENVQGDNVQCTKVLIDGELFILRGEKMYDAKGQLVK